MQKNNFYDISKFQFTVTYEIIFTTFLSSVYSNLWNIAQRDIANDADNNG